MVIWGRGTLQLSQFNTLLKQKIRNHLKDYYFKYMEGIGAALTGLIGGYALSNFKTAGYCVWSLVILSLISYLAGLTRAVKNQERVSVLQSENKELKARHDLIKDDYYSKLDAILSVISEYRFNLGDKERISIYKHNGSHFLMLGRHSEDPIYNEKGRELYPDSQGLLVHAWRNAAAVDDKIPDYYKNKEKYSEYHFTKWKIPKLVSRKFKMKSQVILAYAVKLNQSNQISRKAVIVIESTNKNFLKENKTNFEKSLTSGYEGEIIKLFLEKYKDEEPSL